MRYRKLTAENDYSIGHGAADYYRDSPETVAQAVATRLRQLLGEWFLDETDGTPYQTQVLGRHTQETYDPALRLRILETTGCTGILEYESLFDPDARKLTVRAVIDTIYGEAVIYEVM